MSWYGRVNNSCHLPLLTVIFIFVLRKSLHSCQSSRWLSINTRPRLPSLLMNSQNIKYWIILFDIIIWWCNHCIKMPQLLSLSISFKICSYLIQLLERWWCCWWWRITSAESCNNNYNCTAFPLLEYYEVKLLELTLLETQHFGRSGKVEPSTPPPVPPAQTSAQIVWYFVIKTPYISLHQSTPV